MFLGELLGSPVMQDGDQVGFLSDVRLFVPDRTEGQRVGTPEVFGVVVCPRRARSFVGYERTGVTAPFLLARFFEWRARGSFLVLWADLDSWGALGVELRPDARRWSTNLDQPERRFHHPS